MDELVHHCIHELSFDGDLGKFSLYVVTLSFDAFIWTTRDATGGTNYPACSLRGSNPSHASSFRQHALLLHSEYESRLTRLTTGCNINRLRDFIVDFYAHRTSEAAQTVDDAFCAFVWSVILQQPNILVGVVPEDAQGTDVYIAPQPSSKRKAKANDDETADAVVTLEVIPDAASRSLEELIQQYGDTLRMAVDQETSFVALTGSHNRVRPRL